MDEFLELPISRIPVVVAEDHEDPAQSSDEDDGGPDWTKFSTLASSSVNKPFIPKRGDKEFEPAGGVDIGATGTGLQQAKLERVRAAMFSALDVDRSVSSKVASYAVWYPKIARARVLSARGNHLASMGHNVPRDALMDRPLGRSDLKSDLQKETKKAGKVVELLPEEALYLIERGSMFCWTQPDDMCDLGEDDDVEGTPMTVQQAYAEMIGREDLNLERYQVFAYLKRLGYVVSRAHAPNSFYAVPSPFTIPSTSSKASLGIMSRISRLFLAPFRRIFLSRTTAINWWRPLGLGRFVHRFLSYSSIFSALRFIPCGYGYPIRQHLPSSLTSNLPQPSSPYEVFFNIYKPSTPFRKTAPPPPDYSVIVVNGRTTPMPTLEELSRLFEQLPELPPPIPRKRPMQAQPAWDAGREGLKAEATHNSRQSLAARLCQMVRALFLLGRSADDSETDPAPRPRRPNPFQILKMGKKMIVVAAVDAGMISFFRFCQGAFDEWPMA